MIKHIILVLVTMCSFATIGSSQETPLSDLPRVKAPFEVRRDRILSGQKIKPIWQTADTIVEGVVAQSAETKSSVFIIFKESDLKQLVVMSSAGKWIDDAKELQITVGPNQQPKLKCIMYKGVIRPSNPEVKEWNIDKIVVANDAQFQTVVDGLNSGTLPSFK